MDLHQSSQATEEAIAILEKKPALVVFDLDNVRHLHLGEKFFCTVITHDCQCLFLEAHMCTFDPSRTLS